MFEPGYYIIRDLIHDHYVGRSTVEDNNWDPKTIYSLHDFEVLCSGYPLWKVEKTRRRGLRLLTENGVTATHEGSLVALLVETPRVSGGGWHIVRQPTFGESVYTIEDREGSIQWSVSKEDLPAGYKINVIPRKRTDGTSAIPPLNTLFQVTKFIQETIY